MSEDMKVKDLAIELDLPAKAVVQAAKDLGLAVKNSASAVSAQEAGQIKDKVRESSGDAVQKETNTNVIVRRKKAEPAKEVADVHADTTPATVARLESAPKEVAVAATEVKEAAVKAPVQDKAPVQEVAPKARIVQPPKKSEPVEKNSPPVETPVAPTPVESKQEAKQESAAKDSKANEPAALIVKDTEAVKNAKDVKDTKDSKDVKAAKPAKAEQKVDIPAKVIRPAAKPDASAAPDQSSSLRFPVTPVGEANASARPEGTSQVRVIQAASANRKPTGDRPQGDRNDRPHGAQGAQGDRPQGQRPGGGYQGQRPQGAQGDRPQGQRPAGPGGYQGQRPQGAQGDRPQGQRPAGPGGYQGQRPGGAPGGYQGQRPGGPGGGQGPDRGDRPQGQRPGGAGGQRPGGAGAGAGAGGQRPGGAGGAGRPSGFRPGGDAPQGLPMDSAKEGQSKKKRMKNTHKSGTGFTPSSTEDENFPRMGGGGRRKRKPVKQQQVPSTQPIKAAKRKIKMEEAIRVGDLAHQMGLKGSEVIKTLFNLGVMTTINKSLDFETATIVAAEFEYEVEKVGFSAEEAVLPKEADAPESLKLRPPVVTIMGHVDHGKTSLLDAIRKTNVTVGEAGGITQHIGAYHVKTKKGEIVFLDTPGHEAFTAMRARGAQVTDIVVLVVAADDGVMEQTREAVNHAKAAGVPIMVAVNKIDKETASPEKVQRELSEIGLVPEEWGGDTIYSYVSAKAGTGIDELLEMLALQAEVFEFKANPDKPARGRIVEAKLDKGRGPVATVLIQEGTLKQGDTFVCGVFSGRVRAIFDDQGRKVQKAGPSIPVEVQGFEGVPEAGEEFVSLTDDKLARRIADARAIKLREKELARESRVTLETFLTLKADAQEALVLNMVVKADVQGSLEAITDALHKLSTEAVRINMIHAGAGSISESDILLATASNAIVIGFNVRPTAKVKSLAESEKVDVRFYEIIYKVVEEVKSAMQGMLAPVVKEVYLGQADVREIFSVPKIGVIAGAHVSDGKIARNAGIRLLRDGVVVYTGKISSLKRFKDDAREVLKGYECGVGLENFNDIKVGDVIEAFEMVEEAAVL